MYQYSAVRGGAANAKSTALDAMARLNQRQFGAPVVSVSGIVFLVALAVALAVVALIMTHSSGTDTGCSGDSLRPPTTR
jgi:hypothetical protein